MTRAHFMRLVRGYIRRVEAAAAEAGMEVLEMPTAKNLRRLTRWQVLGESVETIARSEIKAGLRSRAEIPKRPSRPRSGVR